MTRSAFKAWMGEHGGAIVTIVADMWNGFPGMAHTGAARAGVVNLTKTLAIEWAPRRIRVNAVAPGLVLPSGLDTYGPEVRQAVVSRASDIPVGRLGTESETAAAVTFLLSPAAAFITGETLRVDGGSSLAPRPLLPLPPGRPTAPFDGFPPPSAAARLKNALLRPTVHEGSDRRRRSRASPTYPILPTGAACRAVQQAPLGHSAAR